MFQTRSKYDSKAKIRANIDKNRKFHHQRGDEPDQQ